MITNASLTVYHKKLVDREDKWIRKTYDNVWFFGGKGSSLNKGFDKANDVQVRIPYNQNKELNIVDFSIGDILVKGKIDLEINTQQDLGNCEAYNITSLSDNNFGKEQHIHVGGK